MGTGALLGIDGSEYCLSCGGYCVGFFASRDEWCCLALVGNFLFFSFLLLDVLAILVALAATFFYFLRTDET